MNLNESKRVSTISATGTPMYVRGSINHRKANASCSGVVVARQRLELWKIFHKNRNLNLRIIKSSFVLRKSSLVCPIYMNVLYIQQVISDIHIILFSFWFAMQLHIEDMYLQVGLLIQMFKEGLQEPSPPQPHKKRIKIKREIRGKSLQWRLSRQLCLQLTSLSS